MGAPDKSVKKTVSEIMLYAEGKPAEAVTETTTLTETDEDTAADITTETEALTGDTTQTAPETGTEKDTKPTDTSPEEKPESKVNVLPYIIGAVCAAAAVTGIVLFVIKKKKGK